ncbi:MAG: hypothetical protein R6X35_12755 [Candidatus Krumholzibacteriia bacterium]
MAETIGGPGLRRLPSADWVAFGIGIAAMFFWHAWPPLIAVVLVAVFTPSVLRETGILRDADEYTLGVMRRAGFHAALAVGALIFLDHALALLGLYPTGARVPDASVLGAETVRKMLIWVFLISYLIQYWGARGGVTRVLMGAALLNLASVTVMLRPELRTFLVQKLLVAAAGAVVMLLLALVVHRRPRLGGGLLVVSCIATMALLAQAGLDQPQARWGAIAVMAQTALVFGVTGVALLRAPGDKGAGL